jgi:hypothetical protein
MPAAFFLTQHISLAHKFCMRLDAPRFGQNLAALDFFTFNTAQKYADVVAGLA